MSRAVTAFLITYATLANGFSPRVAVRNDKYQLGSSRRLKNPLKMVSYLEIEMGFFKYLLRTLPLLFQRNKQHYRSYILPIKVFPPLSSKSAMLVVSGLSHLSSESQCPSNSKPSLK
jgi:hypothetical protein